MKHYIVTGRVFEVPANAHVELAPEQHAARRHAVRLISGNLYATLAPVQFKQGEQVRTDLDVGKAQMVEVIPVTEGSDPALVAEAAKKATEQAKAPEKAPEKKGRFSRG